MFVKKALPSSIVLILCVLLAGCGIFGIRTLSLSIVGQGTTAPAPGSHQYDQGSEVTIAALPAQGWAFSGWSGNAAGTDNPLTLLMDADKSVTAAFTQLQYALTTGVEPEEAAGSVLATLMPARDYTYGQEVSLLATATAGWIFSHWTGNLTGPDNPQTLLVDGPKTVTAVFVKAEYELTVVIDPAGAGTVDQVIVPGTRSYAYGQTVRLTAAPASNFFFSHWDDDTGDTANPKEITMNGARTIAAHFVPAAAVDVYAAGTAFYGSTGTATYWLNGVRTPLPNANSEAKSIFVWGEDIYVAGQLLGSSLRAVYWKNGTATVLPAGGTASAEAICVTGGDVHVAGYVYEGTVPKAKYWKNGVATTLDEDQSYATSIFVYGYDVYIAGHEWNGSNNIAKCWKNGVDLNIKVGPSNSYAYSVYVANGDVYVAGSERVGMYSCAKYWKNGNPVTLTDGSAEACAYGVAVSGSDVYVVGYDDKGWSSYDAARCWKNGAVTALASGRAQARSICLLGGDVYIGGIGWYPGGGPSYAWYWKNGSETVLPSSEFGGVYSIFVTTAPN